MDVIHRTRKYQLDQRAPSASTELNRLVVPIVKFSVYPKTSLSHNNPCFQCDIAITNFLVLHTCEIRFHDVIGRSVHVYVFLRKNSKTWLTCIDLCVLDPCFF